MDAAIAAVLGDRGGAHQRLQFQHLGESSSGRSHFAERIMLLWSWGVISANNVQWLAEGCVLDDTCSARTKELSRIGTSGQYSGNCRRDLLTIVLPRGAMCKPLQLRAPVLDANSTRILLSQQSIVNPIQVVEMIYKSFHAQFRELFGVDRLSDFWGAVPADDPKLVGHPMLGFENWQQRAIPIVLHGDGAKFTVDHRNSLMVTSWRPLLCKNFEFGTFYLWSLPKLIAAKGRHHGVDTHRELWKHCVHLFNGLFFGLHPLTDPDGNSWQGGIEVERAGSRVAAGDFFFVVWCLAGDLPYLAEEYGLNHFNSNDFCWMCDANRTDVPFTDVSDGAQWRDRQMPWDIGRALRPSDHPIWDLAGVSRWHAPGDLMHTGCLGVLLWLLGGVLYELIYDGPFGGRLEDRRRALWDCICTKYDQLRVAASSRIPDIELDRFRQTHAFAELRAKAAHARHLLPVLCEVCRDLSTGSRRDLHRLAALDNINSIYNAVQHHDLVIPIGAHAIMIRNVNEFLQHYHWLTANSLAAGELCYQMTTKFHYLFHIVLMGRFLNPARVWCYSFESFVGHVVKSARACLPGSPARLQGGKVAVNVLLALEYELGRRA